MPIGYLTLTNAPGGIDEKFWEGLGRDAKTFPPPSCGLTIESLLEIVPFRVETSFEPCSQITSTSLLIIFSKFAKTCDGTLNETSK